MYIKVPKKDQAAARAAGAVRDMMDGRWFVPANLPLDKFEQWLPENYSKTTVKAIKSENIQNVDNVTDDSKTEIIQSHKATEDQISLKTFLQKINNNIVKSVSGAQWIRAEISSVQTRSKGYVSVGLVDTDNSGTKTADTTALIWSDHKDQVLGKFFRDTGEQLKAGMRVLILVEAGLSPLWGFRLTVQDIDPAWTLGDTERQLNVTRQNLSFVWYQQKNLPAPLDFNHIAIIAPVGAGVEDFVKEVEKFKNSNVCTFDLFTGIFEGPNSAKSICKIFDQISQSDQNTYDAVFMVRGGGAASALTWLNDETIVRAVCECSIPVIVGIGHERDHTLLDEVAWHTTGTPSKAAYYLFDFLSNQTKEVDLIWDEVRYHIEQICAVQYRECERLYLDAFRLTDEILKRTSVKVDNLLLEGIGLGPQKTLSRGYTLMVDNQGKRINTLKQIEQQVVDSNQFWLRFQDGVVGIQIDQDQIYKD